MKKFFSFAPLVALVLGCLVFTSCSEPAPYEGKYYNTEFVPNISEAEAIDYYFEKKYSQVDEYRATWSKKSGYVKKTNLKDYELKEYLDSLAIWNKGTEYLIEQTDSLGCHYNVITVSNQDGSFHSFQIVYIELAE